MPNLSALPLIETAGLSRSYRRGTETIFALKQVDLTLTAGTFAVVVGPSGGGKSTLLHLLGGIDRPTTGRLRVNGMALEDANEEQLTRFRRENIGFVFQFYNLLPFINAVENVALPLLALGWRRPAALNRAGELLEQVGLAQRCKHKPSELSGGEQQRVAIARAVAGQPCVVLADEPTGDLDAANSAATMSLLRDLNHRLGTTFVVATHNEHLIEPSDRVFTLTGGHLEPRSC
jgi:ABC-type lipoprotein export system ATPase subunit